MCGSNKVISHDDFNAGFFEASMQAYKPTGNYVASPMSVFVLLSALLTAKGPREKTAKEICEGLLGKRKRYFCDELEYREVITMLDKIRTGVESSKTPEGKPMVTLSDAAFARRGFNIKEEFMKKFTFFKNDKVMQTLFNSSEGIDSINSWVDAATNGLIKKYFNSPNELSPDTVLVLLNAITFSGQWEKPFEKQSTRNLEFKLSSYKSIEVPTMTTEHDMIYFEDDDFSVAAKSFINPRFKFAIFLPDKGFKLDEIEDDLGDGDFKWNQINDNRNIQRVRLQLPKFKIEYKMDLKPALGLLGIRQLFTPGVANLTGISMHQPPLYVSDAKQVAMMDVDEAGVKAAAVTGMSIMPMSLPPKAIDFLVDRPFYCAIYDTEMEMPLFIARVVDPTQQN